MIVIDRPGIGMSDFYPYTITGWPDIVCQAADALHIDLFAVMGYSSGAKFAAACAWKITDRLTSAGILSGNCPYDIPGAKETWSSQDALLYFLADKLPWALRLFLGMVARNVRKDPSSIFSLFSGLSEVDKAALARPDIQSLLNQMVTGAFQQGTSGAALDWKLEARPWGFSLQDISMPVYVWHGEQDKLVPVEQGRIFEKYIPQARAKYYPADGHISLIGSHYEELLSSLLS